MQKEDLVTITQAAELLGNTVQHTRLLVRTGQLEAIKVGRDWIITHQAVMDLKTMRNSLSLFPSKRRGRPRTKRSDEVLPIQDLDKMKQSGNPKKNMDNIESVTSASERSSKTKHLLFHHNSPADQLKLGGIESPVVSQVNPNTKTKVDPRNRLNELTATEWLPETVSVWLQKGLGASHPDAQIERQHPAPFSYQDVSRLIRFFTKHNEQVLDPFSGVGSTLKACALNYRRGIGIELNPRYVQLTQERLKRELPSEAILRDAQKVIQGDSREIVLELQENSVDFVVTSPPYGNILHKKDHKAKRERIANGLDTRYGEDPRDLGNILNYETFLQDVSKILGACKRVLKPKKYMAAIVSDFRQGPSYIMFHSDLARSLEPYGFQLRGMTILYQRHKSIYPYGYPYSFVPNIHNQIILVMQNEK